MTRAARQSGSGFGQAYRMSLISGGLFLNECVVLAASYLNAKDWEATISQLQADGLTSMPKEKSKRRVLREIINRLETLSDDELQFLVEVADRQEQELLIWLSICREYRLIREFTLEVVRDRYQAYQFDLDPSSFDFFLEQKAEWDELLASTSDTTRVRQRQIVFKTMREVGIISDDNRIQTIYLSLPLRLLIEAKAPNDLAVFPGVVVDGGSHA